MHAQTRTPTRTGQPSEGHTSAVNVLRMVNSSREHRAAEPVPFRAKPAPLRSIKPCKADRRATGCAGTGGARISHPDCPDVNCDGHPDNMDTAREKTSSKVETVFWCCLFGVVVLANVAAWMFRG